MEDKLPPIKKEVLFFDPSEPYCNENIYIGHMEKRDVYYYFISYSYENLRPTYWKFLPKPPETNNE